MGWLMNNAVTKNSIPKLPNEAVKNAFNYLRKHFRGYLNPSDDCDRAL